MPLHGEHGHEEQHVLFWRKRPPLRFTAVT